MLFRVIPRYTRAQNDQLRALESAIKQKTLPMGELVNKIVAHNETFSSVDSVIVSARVFKMCRHETDRNRISSSLNMSGFVGIDTTSRLSIYLWGCAVIGVQPPNVFPDLINTENLNCKEFCNIAWALSKWSRNDTQIRNTLFTLLNGCSEDLLSQMSEEDLTVLAKCYTHL